MSWIIAANALTQALEIKGAYDTVKGVYDYGKKLEKADPKKLTWDDVKMFDSPVLNKALAGAKAEQKKATAAEKAKFTLPDPGSLKAWMEAVRAMDKFGKDSKEYKAAMKKYIAILKTYDKTLDVLWKDIGKVSVEMVNRKTIGTTLEQYSKILERAFLNCAKIPMSDAQQATFFVLSQDCKNFNALMKKLVKSYGAIFSSARMHSRLVADTKKTNLDWIKFSEKDLFADAKSMTRNTKLTKPSK